MSEWRQRNLRSGEFIKVKPNPKYLALRSVQRKYLTNISFPSKRPVRMCDAATGTSLSLPGRWGKCQGPESPCWAPLTAEKAELPGCCNWTSWSRAGRELQQLQTTGVSVTRGGETYRVWDLSATRQHSPSQMVKDNCICLYQELLKHLCGGCCSFLFLCIHG